MDIASTNPAVQTASTSGSSALNQLGNDYTTFLQLLTAQISNQDPLEPIDSTTFVTQLAQLTQVEQSVQTNLTLDGLAARLDAMALTSGANLVGQQANFFTNSIVFGEDGAQATYRVASPASTVTAEIYDPTTGQLIRTISNLPGDVDVEHPLEWDGRTDSGQTALTGTYEVRLRALDDQGNQVESAVFRDAVIREVSLGSGQLVYLVDGDEYISGDRIRALR